MTKKKISTKKHSKKPKHIGLIFNKVFEDFKKNQKINERKDLKLEKRRLRKNKSKLKQKKKI